MLRREIELKFKDLGQHRWLCRAAMDHNTRNEFLKWMRENLPDCKVNKIPYYDSPTRRYNYYMEIRGGDLASQTLLALTWS